MTDPVTDLIERLKGAREASEVIDAAYDGHELMLPVIDAYLDPACGGFSAFVMAEACAAAGRDALLFAPSLPRVSSFPAGATPSLQSALDTARALASLSRLIGGRLAAAARLASSKADRQACTEAQREASRLADLLGEVSGG